MAFQFLTSDEVEATKRALDALKPHDWAKPLLQKVREGGGLVYTNRPVLFEARVAHALLLRGVSPEYEIAAGVGNSSIDFAFNTSRRWLVELVSISDSTGVIAATDEGSHGWIRVLRTPALGASEAVTKQSTEHEMLLVEQKIGEKVFRNGEPTKFPKPSDAFHMIMVDMRGYLDGHHDYDDLAQICFGAHGVRTKAFVLNWMNPKSNRYEPIRGLFDFRNPLRSSRHVSERIHFLAFVAEKRYTESEIEKTTTIFCNPHLVRVDEVRAILADYPLARL